MSKRPKHSHDFVIGLAEVLPDGTRQYTKECSCGDVLIDNSKTGMWKGAEGLIRLTPEEAKQYG